MTRLDSSPLVLVTGNPGKVQEARRLCDRPIESVDVDLPEIQSLDLLKVVHEKAAEAWRQVGRPLIVEETGLELSALNGFPGPLVRWMLEAVGADGLAQTAIALQDPKARARCLLVHYTPERQVVAEGTTEGVLVLPGRGEHGFGWDPVFQPLGEERTYGELRQEEKDQLSHRGQAWRALLQRLAEEPDPANA